MQNNKTNLVEATILALQGKLVLEEDKEVKKEALNISLQDDGCATIDTDQAAVTIQDKTQVNTLKPDFIDSSNEQEEIITTDDLEENKKLKTEAFEFTDGNTIFELQFDCSNVDVFDEGEMLDKNVSKVIQEVADKVKSGKSNGPVMDINGNKIGYYGYKYADVTEVDESKKVENESTEPSVERCKDILYECFDWIGNHVIDDDYDSMLKYIGLSDLSLSDVNSENCIEIANNCLSWIIDHAPEDEEKFIFEDQIGLNEDEIKYFGITFDSDLRESKKVENKKLKVNMKSFQKVLENYYKGIYKGVTDYKVSKVLKSESKLKIEGVLTNKFGKTKDICFEASLVKSGKTFNKYNLKKSSNIMLEKKNTNNTSLLTHINKNNVLECKNIKNNILK